MFEIILLGVLVASVVSLAFLAKRLRTATVANRDLAANLHEVRSRYAPILDVEAERTRVLSELALARKAGEAELSALSQRRTDAESELAKTSLTVGELKAALDALEEEANLQSFGFYKPRYEFADSEAYQRRLEEIRALQKEMLKKGGAAVCHAQWTIDGDRRAGERQTKQTLKLVLRAFNGECDAAIAKVKYSNLPVMEARIGRAFEVINELVTVQRAEITKAYLELKLEELHLSHEYAEKVQAEREEQRRIREQMREEEAARRELEKAQQDAEREAAKCEEALRKARIDAEGAEGSKQEKFLERIAELERRLAEAHEKQARATSQAQMTRSGHVYIISNIGSFGEDVFKIGMTRRLDPMDRIKELGDAAVPFDFDVHAMIWSDDAPSLENALHRKFAHRRVNRVNERKEHFRVSIDEIAVEVLTHDPKLRLTRIAAAVEYRKTTALLREEEAAQSRPLSA